MPNWLIMHILCGLYYFFEDFFHFGLVGSSIPFKRDLIMHYLEIRERVRKMRRNPTLSEMALFIMWLIFIAIVPGLSLNWMAASMTKSSSGKKTTTGIRSSTV